MKNSKGPILVVDDNETNRKYVNTVLRNLDRTIYLAENGFLGLEIIAREHIDLVLIDIQMPVMDGFECHDQIRKQVNYDLPILAMTAYSDAEERSKFITYGFNDYITKPVKPEVLKNTVEFWLRERNKLALKPSSGLTPDFDFKIIEELKHYADRDELIELYNEFIKETNNFTEKLLFLQSANDHTEILSILHTIKGNAGSLGFAKLSELVTTLESDLNHQNDLSLNERLSEILVYTSEIFSNYDKQLNLNL